MTQDVEIELDLADLPSINANRGELVQIWTNLIKNACDAMRGPRDEDTPPPRIDIRSWRADGTACVQITDNGPGVPESIVSKIFDPAFTTKKTGLSFGLGLGLSIVQRLVTDYGGQGKLVNLTGGATFRVTLALEQ